MIYFTSDLHLNHEKDFIYKARGFHSINHMNGVLLYNLQTIVQPEDDLWILGDIVLGKFEKAKPLLKLIPGRVHYLIGNHDTDRRLSLYDELEWDCKHYATIIKDGKWNFYLSHYPTLVANYDDNKKPLPLINLYGHTHQKDNFYSNNPYMYHVGVDSHDCKPISLEQIKEDIRRKVTEVNKNEAL